MERSRARILALYAGLAVLGANISDSQSKVQLAPSQSKLAGTPIALTYFGMHVHNITGTTPWPSIAFGTWRLWDSGVAWGNLEKARSVWDFHKLDAYVDLAAEHHVELILPLADTPAWASARPLELCMYGKGCAAEPASMSDWEDYVDTVTKRYKGRIAFYEMWNEANLKMFWSGSPQELIEMQRIAHSIMKRNDPNAQMISANITGVGGLPYFQQLLDLGLADSAEIIGYHLYVFPKPPEAIQPLVSSIESLLAQYRVNKPLWNTECGWAPPTKFNDEDDQAAYVARALVIARSSGIERFLWYAWDNRVWVDLFMTENDNATPTKAARAYATLEKWLAGNRLQACAVSGDQVWSCTVLFADGGQARILWLASGMQPVAIAAHEIEVEDIYGNRREATSGSVTVTASPILVRTLHLK